AVLVVERDRIFAGYDRRRQRGLLFGDTTGDDRHGAVEARAADLVRRIAAGRAVVRALAHDLLQRAHFTVDRGDEDLIGLARVGDRLLGAEAHGVVLAEDGIEVAVLGEQVLHLREAAVGAPLAPARRDDRLDAGTLELRLSAFRTVGADRVVGRAAAD